MSIVCDGCGKSVPNPTRLGRATPRDYCEECEAVARKFMEAEEALRADLHERFVDDRALLIANLAPGNFKLPDVP